MKALLCHIHLFDFYSTIIHEISHNACKYSFSMLMFSSTRKDAKTTISIIQNLKQGAKGISFLQHLVSSETIPARQSFALYDSRVKENSRITQERQILLRIAPGFGPDRNIGDLVQFVGGEVGSIGDRSEVGNEGSINFANGCPVDAIEELQETTSNSFI